MEPSAWIVDVDDASFEQAVLERSREIPVLVDFWAPWCGPCRSLGPILERLAAESGGEFLLAKVNVDESPEVASAFRAQSIPLVVGLRGGEIVDQFVGVKSEKEVRVFLARLLPSEADKLVSRGEAVASSEPEAAHELFLKAWTMELGHPGAALGLAAGLAEMGDVDRALETLAEVMPGGPRGREIDRLAARLRTSGGGGADPDELARRANADPTDPAIRLELGLALAAREEFGPALDALLESIQLDSAYEDGAARRAMIDLFDVLGGDDDLVQTYRRKMSAALYR